jgi:ABC-type lipoprotein export system ATPase subunit
LLLQVRRSRGVTLVMVTHDANVAAIADDRLVLRDGRPVAEESTLGRAVASPVLSERERVEG